MNRIKKEKTFLDYYANFGFAWNLFVKNRKSHFGETNKETVVDFLREFLLKIPGAYLVEDEILPQGVAIKGYIQEVGKTIFFTFKDGETLLAEACEKGVKAFSGFWDEAVQWITDRLDDEIMEIEDFELDDDKNLIPKKSLVIVNRFSFEYSEICQN